MIIGETWIMNKINKKISICIPYHDTPKTAFFLSRLLRSIDEQTFKDYEIILTKEGSMPVNTNAAIQKATGELVKIMFSDDYFAHTGALQEIVDNFEQSDSWLVTGCIHDKEGQIFNQHLPFYNDTDMCCGINGIGSPSVLTMRREQMILFDENLSFMLDCDLYKRLYAKYGFPKILNDFNVVIGLHEHQISNTMPIEEKQKELDYLLNKYKVV